MNQQNVAKRVGELALEGRKVWSDVKKETIQRIKQVWLGTKKKKKHIKSVVRCILQGPIRPTRN